MIMKRKEKNVMKEKEAEAVSIIEGADGPTSIFVAGKSKTKKKSLKEHARQCIYKYRYKKAEKRICANPHTLEEVAAYANKKYDAAEIPKTQKKYAEQYASLREGLIIMHKPELLGILGEIACPDVLNEESAKEMYHKIQFRSEMIANIPDHEMPMDFHIYEISMEDGCLEMEIDFMWDIFGMSYSGNKKTMKKLKKVVWDLYMYYGVSEEDIKNKTKRYSSLLTVLSSK